MSPPESAPFRAISRPRRRFPASAWVLVTLGLGTALITAGAPAIAAPRGGAPAFVPPQSGSVPTVLPVAPMRIEIDIGVRDDLPLLRIDADLTFRVNEPMDEVELLLRPDLRIDVIEDATGVPLLYARRRSRVIVQSPGLRAGDEVTWSFRYRLRSALALRESGQVFSTTPWYPHLRYPTSPLEFQRFVPMRATVRATLEEPWVLVSSGGLTIDDDDGMKTYVWSDSHPNKSIPLLIGRFKQHEQRQEGRRFRGFFTTADGRLSESFVEYLAHTVTFFSERLWNLPRRSFNIVELELPDTISGMTVPGVTLMADRDVAPDSPFPYRILAHEVAHHWWSFGIEIPERADGWLREGLPTYSSLMFLENEYGHNMMRQELERTKRVALSVTPAEPLNNGFDMSSPEAVYAFNYHKAAFVLHMLRNVMGLSDFQRLLRNIGTSGPILDAERFWRLAEDAYGDELDWFAESWVESAEVPRFEVLYESRRRGTDPSPVYEIFGTIEQFDAAVRAPVLLRIPLEAAPPMEATVWVGPGSTEFTVRLPSPPRSLEFDPHGDLMYTTVTIEAAENANR